MPFGFLILHIVVILFCFILAVIGIKEDRKRK